MSSRQPHATPSSSRPQKRHASRDEQEEERRQQRKWEDDVDRMLQPVPPPPPSISGRVLAPPLGRAPPPPPGLRPPGPPPIPGVRPGTLPPRPTLDQPKKPSGFSLNVKKAAKPLAIKLGPTKLAPLAKPSLKPKVASVFADSDSDENEEEEMPLEAKMRMRNVGRETITSSGPNSFGKTRAGFVDSKKLFERELQKAMDDACEENKK